MEKRIQGAKQLIEQQVREKKVSLFGVRFSEHQKVYTWTNENIASYLDFANFSGKDNALSVLASGDHVFNLICNGVTNIDTFDTNALTEFYALGLKRALILKYDYYTFMDVMDKLLDTNASILEISDIITGALPYMEPEHRKYWSAIVDFNYKVQKQYGTNLNLFLLLTLGNNILDSKYHNNYLLNEENYNYFKRKLQLANITFKCANAIDLSTEFTGKYDFILLSNIIDYFNQIWGYQWKYEELKKYLNSLELLCNEDAIIFIKYIYYYGAKINKSRHIFSVCGATIDDLTDEELVIFPTIPEVEINDAMVLKRVKSCQK